jgi:hypothetical protein
VGLCLCDPAVYPQQPAHVPGAIQKGAVTGQLVGLAGKFAIQIADGKHSYDFEYTLAQTP